MNIQKYFSFLGTATRSEYWGVFFISMALLAFVTLLGTMFVALGDVGAVMGVILICAAVVADVWVLVATTARRCRDAGINPWFTVLMFLPYVAIIVNIVFGCLPSDKKE